MTILIVLIGLLISHFATGFRHLRRFEWLAPVLILVQQRWPAQPALVLVTVLVISLGAASLLTWLAGSLLGFVGLALLALTVFILSLGPRDLDRDVAVLTGAVEADPDTEAGARRAMRLEANATAAEGAAAVFHAALSRWFGLLFWFVILGVSGALLYRLTRVALQVEGIYPAAAELLARLRLVLDWPVLFLMTISLGLVKDLDRVFAAWRDHPGQQPAWLMTPSMLDRLAAGLVEQEGDLASGVSIGHQMVWRMLILWLVVLSLFLLAGWVV